MQPPLEPDELLEPVEPLDEPVLPDAVPEPELLLALDDPLEPELEELDALEPELLAPELLPAVDPLELEPLLEAPLAVDVLPWLLVLPEP